MHLIFRTLPKLGSPAVGAYVRRSECLPRCHKWTYTLQEQAILDNYQLGNFDLVLYFDSPVVETWEEYKLESPMDFVVGVGGTMGLILGVSIFSMVKDILEALSDGLKMVSKQKHSGQEM